MLILNFFNYQKRYINIYCIINLMGNMSDRPVKIDNYNVILLNFSIISGCTFCIYIPIIVLYLCKGTFNRLKILQFQLVISAMIQSSTYFYPAYSTQEYLCISKGSFNLLYIFVISQQQH